MTTEMRNLVSTFRNSYALLLILAVTGCAPNNNPLATTTLPTITPVIIPTATIQIPTDTPKPKFDLNRAMVLYESQTAVIYTFNYDKNNLEAANLCLWRKGSGYTFLAQTGEDIRWFLNAVMLDNGDIVYAQYLNKIELAEIWVVGSDGENNRRLISTDTFIALGEGFARAVPHQMVALPNQNRIVFSNSEFGYQVQNLNDLHLVDVDTGELTTLLNPGEGGELIPLFDQNMILIINPEQTLALDVNSLAIHPTNLEPATTETPEETPPYKNPPWRKDCAP
jgi:hypothetical protein